MDDPTNAQRRRAAGRAINRHFLALRVTRLTTNAKHVSAILRLYWAGAVNFYCETYRTSSETDMADFLLDFNATFGTSHTSPGEAVAWLKQARAGRYCSETLDYTGIVQTGVKTANPRFIEFLSRLAGTPTRETLRWVDHLVKANPVQPTPSARVPETVTA